MNLSPWCRDSLIIMSPIWIDGPNTLFNNALVSLLRRHDYQASVQKPPTASLVLRDLQHVRPPFPLPEPTPTMAFVACSDEELVRLIRIGYKGYLRPESDEASVIQAVKAVLRGEIWCDRAIIAQAMERDERRALTAREQQVYELVRRGYTNREIADKLGIRPNTVKVYTSSVLQKLEMRSRAELILSARP